MISFKRNELTIEDLETLNNIAIDCNKDFVIEYNLDTIRIKIITR